MTMTDQTCWDPQITNQVLNCDVSCLERLVDKLLIRVMVLEGHCHTHKWIWICEGKNQSDLVVFTCRDGEFNQGKIQEISGETL